MLEPFDDFSGPFFTKLDLVSGFGYFLFNLSENVAEDIEVSFHA